MDLLFVARLLLGCVAGLGAAALADAAARRIAPDAHQSALRFETFVFFLLGLLHGWLRLPPSQISNALSGGFIGGVVGFLIIREGYPKRLPRRVVLIGLAYSGGAMAGLLLHLGMATP